MPKKKDEKPKEEKPQGDTSANTAAGGVPPATWNPGGKATQQDENEEG